MKIFFLTLVCFISFASADECPFCNPNVTERATFYEDGLVRILYTHKPIVETHFLVIPKRHVERFEELSTEEMIQMTAAIQKLHQAVLREFSISSYFLLQKNGKEVGQTVPHVHFHYLATNSASPLKFAAQMVYANICKPIAQEKMEEMVCRMKEAIEN